MNQSTKIQWRDFLKHQEAVKTSGDLFLRLVYVFMLVSEFRFAMEMEAELA
jgi:hypothetical protein